MSSAISIDIYLRNLMESQKKIIEENDKKVQETLKNIIIETAKSDNKKTR